LYSSPDIVLSDKTGEGEMGGHVVYVRKKREASSSPRQTIKFEFTVLLIVFE
jgi:hypothetical protein